MGCHQDTRAARACGAILVVVHGVGRGEGVSDSAQLGDGGGGGEWGACVAGGACGVCVQTVLLKNLDANDIAVRRRCSPSVKASRVWNSPQDVLVCLLWGKKVRVCVDVCALFSYVCSAERCLCV